MEQDMALTVVVQRELLLQLITQLLEMEWVASMDPTFPLLERWPSGHPLGVPTMQWAYPCIWRGTAGGHIYFALHNFLCKIFHELMQLIVSKVSKFHLKMMWHPPAWGSLLGRCIWLSLPIWGFKHNVTMYALVWASEGAMALTVMASPCNSIAFAILQVACCNSSVEQSRTTDSVAE